MPSYDYACAACGDFTAVRPMAESATPQPCPGCGEPSPRAFRTAPAFSGLPAATRRAHAANEKSADRPALLSEGGHRHGPGCGCCGSVKNARPVLRGADGSKAFPTARPWMISH